MSADRLSLDTNILIYAVDRQAGQRHKWAVTLVDELVEADTVLSLQVLTEFFSVVTRKRLMPVEEARDQVNDWRILFPIAPLREEALVKAMEAVQNHKLSFWDALLWATLRQAGVALLLSEDFQHGRELEGVKFHNPFAEKL